ncbi:MAG TPA: hypothetical protein VHG88_13625 [Burkholderiales bacterium]|nr:hypothetical protein [Burkholderiales bacterium]
MLNDARTHAEPGTLGALDALSDILNGVKRDVARSREVLNGAFGKIAARFAQVHAIAVAAEAREHGLSDEALNALRKVTDSLTIELQFEDSLSQLLDHVQGKVEAIGVALTETRTLVSSAPAGDTEPVGPALEVLARTVKSIQMAADAAVAERSSGSGSVELF